MSDPVMGSLAQPPATDQATPTDPDAPRALNQLPTAEQATALLKLWFDQEAFYKRLRALWKVNALRRGGMTGIYLLKRTDTQEWQAYAPPGSSKQVPALNKAARLCRLLRSILFTDPPEPEATPASDSDEDRDSAEFSTRALIALGGEGNLNDAHSAEQAFDLASTYGSGFRRYYIEPQGGGQRPWDVEAFAGATQYDPADPESALKDPATGQVAPAPYVRKFVNQDFSLSDEAGPTTQRVWLPKLCREILKAPHVRFLPATAGDIWEAQGVLIGSFTTLDDLRARLPGRVPTDPDQLAKLVAYRPPEVTELLPGGRATKQTVLDRAKLPTGDSLVFTVSCYYLQGPTYPKGYYAIAAGEDLLLYTGTWTNEKKGEPLDLPLDQFKQIDDESSGHGVGLMTCLGPGNEIRAGTLGGMLEHLDRFTNRKVFYPFNSPFQPRSAQAQTGTYIPIPIGGKPETEQVPDFPKATMDMFALISAEMDHEAGLEPPVSGQNPPSVESGLHARTIIEQVNVGLSDIRNNVVRGLTRGWRIQLQQMAWKYTTPQMIGWVGDDGAYKQKEWTASDLGSTKDVMLHKGTLSMLSPSAKLSVAEQMGAMQIGGEPLLAAEDLRRIVIGNVGGLLGLQDNPHRQRVRRQIGEWAEGPPPGWGQQASPLEQQAAAPAAPPRSPLEQGAGAQAPGMPASLPPAPPPPDPIWAPFEVDSQPDVALIRVREIGRLMSSTRYSRWPQGWRAAVDQEYLRMRQAAGIQTVAEQQQAAQQQAQAQQQAEQAKQQDVMAQVGPALKQTQEAVAQLGAELKQQVGGLTKAVTETQQELQTLAKAVEAVTEDADTLAQGVDAQMAEQAKATSTELQALRRELEGTLRQLAQTLKPAAAAPLAPVAGPVTHVHVPPPPAQDEETEFEITNSKGQVSRVKRKKKKGPSAPPEPGNPGPSPLPPGAPPLSEV